MAYLKRKYGPVDEDTPDILGKYQFDPGDEGSLGAGAARSGGRSWKSYVGDVGADFDSMSSYGAGTEPDPYQPAAPPQGKYASPEEERATHETLTGSQGDAAQKLGTLPDGVEGSDWQETAPEAIGSNGVKTNPENAVPRDNSPIGKYDVPTAGSGQSDTRKRLADAEAELDKTLKEVTGWRGAPAALLGLGGFNQSRVANLQNRVHALQGQVAYEDNRRGAEAAMRAQTQLEREKMKGATALEVAKMRADASKARSTAIEKGKVDKYGHLVYMDPETGQPRVQSQEVEEELAGPAPEGGSAPTRKYEKPFEYPVPSEAGGGGSAHYETDDAGNVTEIRNGKLTKLGKLGKSKDKPEKPTPEDPAEKRAQAAATAAEEQMIRDGASPEDAAAKGQAVYVAHTAAMAKAKAGVAPPDPSKPPIGAKRTSKKTGKTEIFTSTGWQPYTGSR